jgi:hypothetical protein
LVGGLLGAQTEWKQVNDERDAFFQSFGDNYEGLAKKAASVGMDLRELYDAKTVKDYEAAVKHLTDMFDAQGQAQQKLDAAIEKYGFTIDQLGPKFKQQKLDEEVGGLLQDYNLLVASGISVNDVISKMGPNIEQYVLDCRKAGVAIPEAMRPAIQAMADQGTLVDENGNKIEVSSLSWTKTMSEGLDAVCKSIDRLVQALTGVASPAATAGRAIANIPPIPSGTSSGGYVQGGSYDSYADAATRAQGYATGTDFINFGVGRTVRLHGEEAVVRRDQAGSFAEKYGGSDPELLATLRAIQVGLETQPARTAAALRAAQMGLSR